MTASSSATGFEIRPIGAEELPAYAQVPAAAFAQDMTPERLRDWAEGFEFERSLAAFDGDRIVGTGGADSLELTLPGGVVIPVGGLTAIAVLPTHRRRGILRAIIERHFQDCEARGEAVSALLASESVIYGRFGYGPATDATNLEIDPRHGAFRQPPPTAGRVRLLDSAEAAKLLPDLHERHRRARPGEVSRKPSWWTVYERDPEYHREGFTRHFDAVYEPEPGQVDGWASYRLRHHWADGLPAYTARVSSLYALSAEAEAALLRYCLDLDLVATVQFEARPVDEPLRWLLADPRRLRVTASGDFLWVRLLDLPSALAARRYSARDALVIEVRDPLRPRNQGRFRLEGGPDGAACQPTRAAPDLALDIAELGAAYLGGTRFTTLARASRVAELTPGALLRADAMFTSNPVPWCTTDF
jgi:predicted acetyltransferase